jgi:hypothetical protein
MLLLGWFLTLALAAPASAEPARIGAWSVCDGPPWFPASACAATPLHDVDPQGRMLWVTATVRLDRRTPEPVAVSLSAYASSAVYWDGKRIGMNGAPSARPELERPGLRDAAFLLPDAAPGTHRLTVAMSSHKGFLRLRSPVTRISIAPYERPSSTLMRDYLPALISAGGLTIMVLIFALLAWGRERKASGSYLLGAALFAIGQLGAEASRAFVEFPYPILFVRIGLVLAFAAGFGFMLLTYLARRFGAGRPWPILAVQALAAAMTILLVPSFDQRTGLILTSAMTIGMLLAIHGATRRAPGARPLVAVLAVGILFSVADPHSFLNRELYLWLVGLFALLFAAEAPRVSGQAAAGGGVATACAPPGLWLGAASERRFVVTANIVRVAAADDYSEVFLAGGASVLHPEPLQKLVERLAPDLVRVHRSHAINPSHLRAFRKGANSNVLLSDQSVAPVSRRRIAGLESLLKA